MRYPDYELAANHISHYRDKELVTFSVDRVTHSLVVTFPVFIKDFKQPPLSLFEIETVPVPIPDRNRQADSYSKVRIQKDYIAAGMDYYIQIRMTQMLMCKSIGYIYYCEELFVVKHKSKHSCASAIFYELGPSQVIRNCKCDYMYNETVPPVILDGGKDILLANFQGPRSLKCTSVNGGLAKPAPEHTYTVVDREFLCDCQLYLEYASVLRQLSSCNRERSSKLVMQFHVNIAFWELLRERHPQTAELVQPKFTDHRQIFEVKLFEGKPRWLDQPTDLETFMERIDKNGKRIPSKSMLDDKNLPKPLLPRWINNILVIISTVVSTLLALLVLVLLTKHFMVYDTVNISWGDIQVLENEIPIKLPRIVSISLRHKIKNRRLMSFDWDVQYMVKQGPNWYNLTRTYKTKMKAVSFANLNDTDEEETSSLCGRMTTHCERSSDLE